MAAPTDDEEARRRPRWNPGGTPEQILEDLAGYAEAGFSVVNLAVVAPSATWAETAEQTEWLARDVLPEACKLVPRGDWKTDL